MRSAFFAFVLTRSIILLLFVLTAQLQVRIIPNSDATTLSASRIQFYRIIAKRVSVADANWYMGIAHEGYVRKPFVTDKPYNWAFFPLYPLTLRAVSKITHDYALSGVILSSLYFFLALLLLHKTALLFGSDTSEASRTVLYMAAFPVSYFYALPVTESLFLLLTVATFYCAKREWWWLAGITGALASATRITGVLLLPAMIVLYWETYRTFRLRFNFLPLLLIPTGLVSYMWFLKSITGNPLAFIDIMVVWGRAPGSVLAPLIDYLRQPLMLASGWDFRLLNFISLVTALISGLVLAKWRMWSLSVYLLAALLVMLSSGLLQGQSRYVMVLFPVFIVIGRLTSNVRVHLALLTSSLILLVLTTVLFCYQVGFAMS